MFGIDEADNTMAIVNAQTPLSTETTTTTSSEPDSSCATMIEINPIATDNAKDTHPMDQIVLDDKNHQVRNILVTTTVNGYHFFLKFFFILLPIDNHS